MENGLEQLRLCNPCIREIAPRGVHAVQSLRYCQEDGHRLTPRCPQHDMPLQVILNGDAAQCRGTSAQGAPCTVRRNAVTYRMSLL